LGGMNFITAKISVNRSTRKIVVYLLAAVLFFCLAFDGRLHWDEPGYLYVGGYLSIEQILEGQFPFHVEGFYLSRILHLLLIHTVVKVIGLGIAALAAIVILYLFMLFAFSYFTYLILRELLPQQHGLDVAVVVSMFIPLYLYLAFKTMPEIPGLLLIGIATFGLIRSMKQRTVMWLTVTAFSLAGVALMRNLMALLYLSFIVAMVLCKRQQYPPFRLVQHAFISGVSSLIIFYIALRVMGIGLGSYFEIASLLAEKKEPLVSLILHIGLEGGVFFLALPLAFLSSQKKEAIFFAIWLLAATIPLPLLFEHIEARYLAPNLIAFSGLIYLALDGITSRIIAWWQRSKLLTASVGWLVLTAIFAFNMVGLMVMSHEVRVDQFQVVLARLDRLFGNADYAILTPWSYTDFHYLRFVYPDRPVYSVYATSSPGNVLTVKKNPNSFEDHYYAGRMIRTLEELEGIPNAELVYVGFEENFPVANLRAIACAVPAISLDTLIEKMSFLNHLSLSWMWDHPQLVFSEIVRYGHYVAYDVKIDQNPQSRVPAR
jgi:hypothetical protein